MINNEKKNLATTLCTIIVTLHCLLAAPAAFCAEMTATTGFDEMVLADDTDAGLTAAVDLFVDHVADVTAAFCFDLYQLRYAPLTDRRLTVDEAVHLYDLVDIHVTAAGVDEVPMLELYDDLNDLALECIQPDNATLFQHTLVDLFVTGKGAPSTWQVFRVVLSSPPNKIVFYEYVAVHGPTGSVYVIELGK